MKNCRILMALYFIAYSMLSCEKKVIEKEIPSKLAEQKTANTDTIKRNVQRNLTEIQLEPLNKDALNKIWINSDSILQLNSEIRKDHRIFGFLRPDTTSRKLILFSVFTNEVENNPFQCQYGSYYSIENFIQKFTLKYENEEGNFFKAEITDSLGHRENIYFEKKWLELE